MFQRVVLGVLIALLCSLSAMASGEDFGDDGFTRPGGPVPRTTASPPRPAPTPRNVVPVNQVPPPPVAVPVSVPAGTWHQSPVVVVAAGRSFRIRGLYLSDRKVSLVNVQDRQLRELFRLYGATVRWDTSRGAAVVSREGTEWIIADGATEVPATGSPPVHLDTPLSLADGEAWLPVACLPHFLPGELQGLGRGKYAFDPLVTDLSMQSMEGGGATLSVACAVPMKWKAFMLKSPNRYILDLQNVVLDLDRYKPVEKRSVEHPGVGRIRFDQFSFKPNVVRVVIPLGENQELRVLPRSTSTHLVVAIAQPTVLPHAEDFNQQQITDMRVDRGNGTVKVTLVGSGPFQYEWHRLKAPDNRFFLDISQAVLAGPRRVVDLSGSRVDLVRLGQYQTTPVPTVRLLLEMDRPGETRVYPSTTQPNALVVEVREGRSVADEQGYGATRMPSARKIVCIDAGHGGSDPGAWNPTLRIYEKDVTLDVARRLAARLRSQGWQVVMTRNSDRDVSYAGSSASEELGARVRVAHDFHADLFVSIHCNASSNRGVSGTSTHWYKSSDRQLASSLHPHVVGSIGTSSRGLIRNRFYVLRCARIPSVLIETAFITNLSDGRKLGDPDFRQKLAEGIAEGITIYVARNAPAKASQR